MPNIHDVAKLSGVHRSTVSRVLTGRGAVSEKSRKKVLKAARKINYHINTVASALKSQRKTALGFLSFWKSSPNPSEAYYQQTLAGIIDAITQSKYHLLLNNIQGTLEADNEELKFCHESLLAGVILMAPRTRPDDLEFLNRVDIPALLLFYRAKGKEHSWLDLDNRKGVRMAVEHLVSLGHKRIAFIGGEIELSTNASDRYEGYREALKSAGLTEDPKLVRHSLFWLEFGRESARYFLSLPPAQKPTAIFCSTDMMAFGALEAAKELGLSVPRDVSVVGFDDYEKASHSDPPLTTVRQDFYAIGKKAVETLEALIHHPTKPKQILVEPELMVRSSTAPPPRR
jgi:LacI family transcriptional regulator